MSVHPKFHTHVLTQSLDQLCFWRQGSAGYKRINIEGLKMMVWGVEGLGFLWVGWVWLGVFMMNVHRICWCMMERGGRCGVMVVHVGCLQHGEEGVQGLVWTACLWP